MNGASPRLTYHVRPVRSSMVPRTIARSLTAVRSITSPSGVTSSENPVGDTCTSHRPVSIARSRLDATCCVWTIVPV
jgi:hypothetical protein